MTDLDHFLVGALRDVSGVDFVLEEPQECRRCGSVVDASEHTDFDDARYCLEDACQPCCATDGVHFGYSRSSPCPDCLWCLNHPDEAARL